jgi:UDP:flavonoid glycosyltransferase YjiC (YdhE family)
LTHRLIEQLVWQPFRRTINDWRRRILRLPPVPFWGPYGRRMAERPILCAYSPAIIPPPPAEHNWLHVTGFWFLDREPSWQPLPGLVEFLHSGPAPVYIGFGSINFQESDAALSVMADALFTTKLRAVMLGTPAMPEGLLANNIYVTHSTPFDWLFPQVAAVVHHGGAGTTACGLRAGVPTVVIPFKGEQMFFGHTVARLGAGPTPMNRRRLTTEAVHEALCQATTNSEMKRRALALAAKLGQEDGVGNAVAVFERLVTAAGRRSNERPL